VVSDGSEEFIADGCEKPVEKDPQPRQNPYLRERFGGSARERAREKKAGGLHGEKAR